MRILVVSVHPDDETLGCGGTILKHNLAGDEVHWLILTHAQSFKNWSDEKKKRRNHEIQLVAKRYSFKSVVILNFETTRLDVYPMNDLVFEISRVIKQVLPDTIYLHNRSDVHSDHQVSFRAIISATKTFNNPGLRRLLTYETVSETEFAPAFSENAFCPNYFVDISEFMEEKLSIFNIYESEIKEHPFPRSNKNIKGLGTFRGAQCGVEYAEAFMILKDIWQ